MDISDQSETYRKGGYTVSQEVKAVDSDTNVCISGPLKYSENQTNGTTDNQQNTTVIRSQPQQALYKDMSLPNEQSQELHRPESRKTSMNAAAIPFEPTATCGNSTPPLNWARFMEAVKTFADTCIHLRIEKLPKLEGILPCLHRFCTGNR